MSIKNITYIDLIEACEKPGCLACTLTDDMVERYIRMLFHEHINDPPSREKLRLSHGLCRTHSWTAINHQLGNALGFAIISHDVLGKLLQDLEGLQVDQDGLGAFRKLLMAGRGEGPRASWFREERICPVCQHQVLVEERVLKTLVGSVQKEALVEAIRKSDGLCLPHLQASLVLKVPAESTRILLDLAQEQWEGVRFDLSEFIRKNDYRFSKEGFGEEKDSWLRASALLKGNRP